jgi:DNA-binding transcriptional regulator YiaG
MSGQNGWTCSNCGAAARVARGTYRFTESGLGNVYLAGLELIRCPKCKNVDPIIPNMRGLMRFLALAVLEKPWRLSGDEIRYLRKYLRMTGEQFASHLGVDKTTLSKWENDRDPVGEPSDRLIRAITLTMGEGLKASIEEIVRKFPGIGRALRACRYNIDTKTQQVEYA